LRRPAQFKFHATRFDAKRRAARSASVSKRRHVEPSSFPDAYGASRKFFE
jgi:hypothetical protein